MRSPVKKIQTGGNYADQMRSIVAPQAAMGSVGVNPMMRKRMKQGGDVQSESSKLDQKNAEMDKAQAEGLKRYQAEQAKEAKANADSRRSMPSFNFGKPEKKAKGGEVTFLTKDRQEKADNSMKAQRMRERDSIAKGRTRDIESSKPGAPYYRANSLDTPDEAVVRAKAQGKYMAGEVGPIASKQDEGVLAPAARTLKNVMGGKRGEEATKDTDGDPYYKRRTREEGDKAVSSYRGAKENQKEYGMKKGGKVSASSRGDGIATKGKTRGRIV